MQKNQIEDQDQLPDSLWGFLWCFMKKWFEPNSPRKVAVEFTFTSFVVVMLLVIFSLLLYLDTNLRNSISMIREIPQLRKDVDEIKRILEKHNLIFIPDESQIIGEVYAR